MALLVVATVAALGAWLAAILSGRGFGVLDLLLLVAFLVQAPWLALAFWNAVIGFALVAFARDPLARVMPQALQHDPEKWIPVFRKRSCSNKKLERYDDSTKSHDALARLKGAFASRTAVLMTVRDEDPAPAIARLAIMRESLDRTGLGAQFDFFVLSDSSDPAVAAAEEAAVAAWRAGLSDPDRVTYRRRAENTGFKSGNVRDFCERWGSRYEFMLLLDIDSLMTGDAVVDMVRIIEANPRIGILQSIGVGVPAASLFARVVQFGHRTMMRVVLMGAAWWQADCGSYWGHNAVVRVDPFLRHCGLPVLPGGAPLGGVLISHDQIEAALMRRAGFEVRVLPLECGSFEGNPPALPEFIARSFRWCQGNLQNLRLIGLSGLAPVSRVQLLVIMDQNIGAAAIVVFAVLSALAAATWPAGVSFPARCALGLYLTWLAMLFAPRLLGLAHALIRERKQHGGAARLLGSGLVECAFAILLLPIWYTAMSLSMLLLLGGRSTSWTVQQRESSGVTWRRAAQALWPASLLALALIGLLALAAPGAIVWFLPFLAGLLLAVPFAAATARPALGAWAARHKLCPAPEEIDGPWELAALVPLATSHGRAP